MRLSIRVLYIFVLLHTCIKVWISKILIFLLFLSVGFTQTTWLTTVREINQRRPNVY